MPLHGTLSTSKQAIFRMCLRNSSEAYRELRAGVCQRAAARWSRAALTGSIATISTAASSRRARTASALLAEIVCCLLLSPELCALVLFGILVMVAGARLTLMVAGA